jgi:hypothetical protein
MPDEQNPGPDAESYLSQFRFRGWPASERLNWEVGHVHAADAVQPEQVPLNRAACAYELA